MRALIPNSTQVPDVLLDHWMAELSGAEFKVLLYIARRTYGFGKTSDSISLSQIANGITKRDGTVLDRGTGISKSSVSRAITELLEKGIVIRQNNLSETTGEFEESTYQININWEPPSSRGTGGRGGGSKGSNAPSGGVVPKSDDVLSKSDEVLSKDDHRSSQNRTRVIPKSDIQETDQQETVQETAAEKKTNSIIPSVAAADLIEELIGQGVGRSAAALLVQQKPAECKRQLEYLPFVEIKKSKGAWLANAIRGEFGPPAKYLKVISKKQSKAVQPIMSASKHQMEHAERNLSRTRNAYEQIRNTKPEAIEAFREHLDAVKKKASRFALEFSKENREMFDAHLRTDGYLYEEFGKWLKGQGAKYVT